MTFSSKWKCWKNGDGIVTTIRKHLKGTHSEEHERVCKLLNLKHSDKPADETTIESAQDGPFDLKEWLRCLVKWIVVDDQVFLTCFCIACTISNSQSSLSTLLNVPNFVTLLSMATATLARKIFPTVQNLLSSSLRHTSKSTST